MEFKQKIVIRMKIQVIHMIKKLQCYIQQHNQCVGWPCWTSMVSAWKQYTLLLCEATNRIGFIRTALIQFAQWFSMHCIISSSIGCIETMCVTHGIVSVKSDTVKQRCKSFLSEYIFLFYVMENNWLVLKTNLSHIVHFATLTIESFSGSQGSIQSHGNKCLLWRQAHMSFVACSSPGERPVAWCN